jgi:uncharacterized protein (DUF924 family)
MNSVNRGEPPAAARQVLEYWIGNADNDPEEARSRNDLWFSSSANTDAEIERRFADIVVAARAGNDREWSRTPEGLLARIIVLDQFPRNLYRGTAEAFSSDSQALRASLELQSKELLEELGWMSRVFALMPMQHAEDLAVQERSVELFESLASKCDTGHRPILEHNAKFARLHRDIVRRFGRFPHRNRILGRTSTAEEEGWLEDGAPTFGQGG